MLVTVLTKTATNWFLTLVIPIRLKSYLKTGIEFDVPSNTKIIVKGIDKELVGATAAKIRSVREPEPYKGKGIKYEGERILRKEGKAGKKK